MYFDKLTRPSSLIIFFSTKNLIWSTITRSVVIGCSIFCFWCWHLRDNLNRQGLDIFLTGNLIILCWTLVTNLMRCSIYLENFLPGLIFLLALHLALRMHFHLKQVRKRPSYSFKSLCTTPEATFARAQKRRRHAKHSRTPLLRRKKRDFFDLWLLPEESAPIRPMFDPLYLNYVRKIGSGSYGSIYQVEHKITGRMMAVKRLSVAVNTNVDADVEIRALMRLQETPWTPTVLSTFKNNSGFYILMPLYERGDLYKLMMACGGCLSRALAKFYLCEMLLGIHAIHGHGIIHRDLKPENLLFSDAGHLIIADFGVATVFNTKDEEDTFFEDEFPLWTNKRRIGGDVFPLLTPSYDNPHIARGHSGTLFYSAPEVLRKDSYSYGVDYYAMGVLYHEMVTGFVPFRYDDSAFDDDKPEISLSFERDLSHLQNASLLDLDFLEKVLHPDPYSRPSVADMKTHKIFSGVDWIEMAEQRIPVPHMRAARKRVSLRDAYERPDQPM